MGHIIVDVKDGTKERRNEMEKSLQAREEFQAFVLMDALDDDLIVQELEGRLPEVLTYHFTDKNGKEIWGLSKAGVDEATGELAKKGEVIRELELTYTDKETEGLFNVKSGRYVVGKNGQEILLDVKFGTKRQPKQTDKKVDNPFWYEQGSMKAARNAASRLIPEHIKQGVIEYAKNAGKVKEIKKEEIETESKTKFSIYHDEFIKCDSLESVKEWWGKNNIEAQKGLLPEHFKLLQELKDKLKEKYSEKKEKK